MSSCLYLHPSGFQVAASFVYFIICCYTPPVWLIVCFYVCISLSFSFLRRGLLSIMVVLDCVSPLFFLCPTSSFCSVPSSSLPVLIWKCFGLQRMMVVIEEIKWPCGPINSLFKKPIQTTTQFFGKISNNSSRLFTQWRASLWWTMWIMKHSCTVIVVFVYVCLLGVNYQQC